MKMMLPVLLLVCSFVLASIRTDAVYIAVAADGAHEMSGALSFRVVTDEFPLASPEQPVYIRVNFGRGVVLADTLVDPLSSDPNLATPVFLSMWAPERITAPPTTLAIVEWRAGQSDFWIRLQHPTSSWLERSGQPAAPDDEHPVIFNIGYSAATLLRLIPGGPELKNLPFPTRNPQLDSGVTSLEEAVDTYLCLDLTKSGMVPGNVVKFTGEAFAGDALNSMGLYDPGTLLPNRVISANSNAYLIPRVCGLNGVAMLPQSVARSDAALQSFSGSVRIEGGCIQGDDYRTVEVGPEAGVHLAVVGDGYGFAPDSVSFVDQPTPGILTLEDPFQLRDQTLYRSARLAWDDLDVLPHAIEVAYQLTLDGQADPHDLMIVWDVTVITNPICPNSQEILARESLHAARLGALEGAELIPHLTSSEGGFHTNLILTNPGTETASYHLTSYAEDGLPLRSMPVSIEPGQTGSYDASLLLGSGDHAYLSIPWQEGGRLLAAYQASHMMGAPAQVVPTHLSGRNVRFFPGDGILTWDGLALVNAGADTAMIVISQKGFDGETLASQTLPPLGPGEKIRYLPETEFNFEGSFFFDISSNMPLYVTALRGDRASNFLWENYIMFLP